MADVKVLLLRDVIIAQEGGHVTAGKTLVVPSEIAERWLRIGAAEKVKRNG